MITLKQTNYSTVSSPPFPPSCSEKLPPLEVKNANSGAGSVGRSVCYTNMKVCVQILNYRIKSWLSCIRACL